MCDEIILKYNKPSRFDYAEQGTVVKVKTDIKYEIYIQISPYKNQPNWVTWGYFLGLIFKNEAFNKKIVQDLIDKFNYKKPAELKSL